MRNEKRDLLKLAAAFFKNLQINDLEFGGIGLDCKRPFGNSFVESDILEIIEAEAEGEGGCWSTEQEEYAHNLYHERLIPFLKEYFLPICVGLAHLN